MDGKGVVLCNSCGKTTTENLAFEDVKGKWICQECVVIMEALALNNSEPLGRKYDSDKLRLDLIPPEYSAVLGAIFTMGAHKYGDDNWKQGMMYSRLLGAANRHLLQRWLGERCDQESGLPHLGHCMWNIGAMMYYDLHEEKYKAFDNITTECPFATKLFIG